MAKAAKIRLTQAFDSHAQNINETFQMLDQTDGGSLKKVEWSEVIKLGDEVSKQATIDTLNVGEVEQNMGVYCNILQGFLLNCVASMVGAGPTLSSNIRASAKQVTDSSMTFFRGAISSYESRKGERKLVIPRLSGSVWEACAALKKTPSSNYTAVGRAITQVAVSIKDVIREMKELKMDSTLDHSAEGTDKFADVSNQPNEDDGLNMDELGTDLSPEEMTVAQSTISVISDALLVIKELIRFISGLARQPNMSESVDSLERLLGICQGIGGDVDELGASVYPPQELSLMKTTGAKISSRIERIRTEVAMLPGSPEGLYQVCDCLDCSLRKFETLLGQLNTGLEDKIEGLSIRV
ncbi:uncharacterized protein [Aristolochia californica]|uniref:uncharacterized protein isoform X2 n=1 Tax=Aristolochia californica TaxID=171875 RepID=UPI0035E2BE69